MLILVMAMLVVVVHPMEHEAKDDYDYQDASRCGDDLPACE